MNDTHSKTVDEVLKGLRVSERTGLDSIEVDRRIKEYGPNELKGSDKTPFWQLVLEQFEDTMVRILLFAAVISFALAFMEEGEKSFTAFVEPFVILLILILNAIIGVVQEQNAEDAIEKLKQYEPDAAICLRDGKLSKIEASKLVPGDIIDIAVGDKIPADSRVVNVNSSSLRVDQSILTGESVSVTKHSDVVPYTDAVNQDKTNILFSGTTISMGKARAIVVATGYDTEIGKIAESMTSQEGVVSPLKKKLDDFGELLSKIIMIICIIVWIINIGHFSEPEHGGVLKGAIYYFKIAVALAVAAIPEGLPAVVTTCLALGTHKMAKKNAIVRSLPSVETLGCTTVICSDKTGTLTTNKMSTRVVMFAEKVRGSSASLRELEVTGSNFAPEGQVLENGIRLNTPLQDNPILNEISRICSLCNESSIDYNEKKDVYEKIGEPTEVALKVLVEKLGLPNASENFSLENLSKSERTLACNDYWEREVQKHATMEFSRDRKSMSVVVQSNNSSSGVRRSTRNSSTSGSTQLYVKGAPENVLERCTHVRANDGTKVPLTANLTSQLLERMTEYGSKETLRCLALAVRDEAPNLDSYNFSDPRKFVEYESNLTFIGMVGMLDPPRQEVRDSIYTCRNAGIRVIVITGDNKATAESICRKIGVFSEDENLKGKSFTGREFEKMTETEKISAVQTANLFSRVEPAHKTEFVRLLQSTKEVVAMTGDGVNDAPSIKQADIGIAMGSGTAVAKEVASMVLADDNFSTIVEAVKEGRAIYNNTKQFIRYLISSNIGEVVSIFLTAALGFPEALIPVQLLWVNLVTDGLPATALGFNKPDADIMRIPPRGFDDPIISGWMLVRYLIVGVYIGVGTVFGYAWWMMYYSAGPQVTMAELINFRNCTPALCEALTKNNASTMSLSILVLIEMLNTYNSLSENQSLFQMKPWANMWVTWAVVLSLVLHAVILYIPYMNDVFSVAPLNYDEWMAVFYISAPVIVLDEVMKILSRTIFNPARVRPKKGYRRIDTDKTS